MINVTKLYCGAVMLHTVAQPGPILERRHRDVREHKRDFGLKRRDGDHETQGLDVAAQVALAGA